MTCALHQPDLPQPKAVTVNGVTIARDAIAREVQHHPAGEPILAWKSATRALVIRELLLQEARRTGVVAEPMMDTSDRRETEEEALIRTLVERDVNIPQSDAEACRRYYEQNRRAFRSATIYEARHVLFAVRRDDRDAFEQARRAALAVLEQLKGEPQRFGEMAERHSDCPSAAQGGNLGQITSAQTTPEFEAALAALQPGEMSEAPVATRYGFHIIQLVRRIDGVALPFDAVADRIADYLRDSVMRRASAQYIARLVSRASIAGASLEDAEAHRTS